LSIILTQPIHHAYVLEGEREAVLVALMVFLESEFAVRPSGNPDFWQRHADVFGIDEARELKELQGKTAVAGDKKIFVASFGSITREAQNALLKVLEEPTPGTHVFLIVPQAATLLPTLLSRVVHVRHSSAVLPGLIDPGSFMAASKAERLDMLKGMADSKDKGMFAAFLDSLETALHERGIGSVRDAALFAEIIKARGYARDRSSSIKLLAEHIALVLPRLIQ
jgi:hypothetical protein